MTLPTKARTLSDGVTLTASLVAGSTLDVTEYTEVTLYLIYTPGTSADSIQYNVEFSNDGTNWHPEPDETVASGVATVITKSRTFTSTSGSAHNLPVVSMPVADKFLRVRTKETAAGSFGTVTVNALATRLR